MRRLHSVIQSAAFRIFYLVALIAWTIAFLGLASGVGSGSKVFDYLIVVCSLFVTALGWFLPVLQNKIPTNVALKTTMFYFPILCSVVLATALVLGLLFGAA